MEGLLKTGGRETHPRQQPDQATATGSEPRPAVLSNIVRDIFFNPGEVLAAGMEAWARKTWKNLCRIDKSHRKR